MLRNSQPQYAVEINRSHPISLGLVNGINGFTGTFLRNQRKVSTYVGGSSVTPSIAGLARAIYTQVGYADNPELRTSTCSTTTLTFAIASGGMAMKPAAICGPLSMTAHFCSYDSDGVTVGKIIGQVYAGSLKTVGGSFIAETGKPYVSVLRHSAGVGADIWVNGVKDPITATFTNTHLGRHFYGGSNSFVKPLLLHLVWSRALSDSEIKIISDNPWQVLQPASDIDTDFAAIFVNAASGASAVMSEASITYSVLNNVSKDLSMTNSVYGSVQQSSSMVYTVYGNAQSSLSLNYTVKNYIQQSASASYNIRTIAQSDISLDFSILTLNAVVSSSAFAYNVKAYVISDAALAYNVKTALQVSNALSYYVRNAVQSDSAYAYNIVGKLQKDLTATYSIINSISASLDASYAISESIAVEKALSYSIRAGLYKDLVGAYNVIGKATASITTAYNVLASVQSSVSLAYAISNTVGTTTDVWGQLLSNGLTAEQTLVAIHTYAKDIATIHGLILGDPLIVTDTSRAAGSLLQVLDDTGSMFTVTRQ